MTTSTTARAWAISRSDGLVLGFTDHDVELAFEGIVFRPNAGMTARAVVQGTGLSVDNSEAIGALSDQAINERDIIGGRWDGAELRQWEVEWQRPSRHRLIFRGHLGEISCSGGSFTAELRGLSEPLGQPAGRVFHPRCSASLGDSSCKVNRSRPGLLAEGIIAEIDGSRLKLNGIEAADDRWFERGRLLMVDGHARGLFAHIKNDRALPENRREIDLWAELGILPAVGDRVRLFAGCDKSGDTCRAKFANYLNFRGFPHLPHEDWLMAPGAASGRGSAKGV